MEPVLEQVRRAFGGMSRPAHFTDHEHCEECAEHDETLRSHDPATIGLHELGNPGWDPICFASIEGFLYYMPGLARLALGTGDDYYLDQFLFHLNAERIAAFNQVQRDAVRQLLEYIRNERREDVEAALVTKELEDRIRRLLG